MSDAGLGGNGPEGTPESELGPGNVDIASLEAMGLATGLNAPSVEGVSGVSTPSMEATSSPPIITPEEKEETKEEIKEEAIASAETKPIITRAKRKRSLFGEEQGGLLRKAPVYRRSLLGR